VLSLGDSAAWPIVSRVATAPARHVNSENPYNILMNGVKLVTLILELLTPE